jgi:hypothetical protein
MSNSELNQNVSLDDLLDGTLDDLADVPEFKPFAAGAHKMTLKFDATKKINDMPAIEVKLTIIESVELTDPTATPPAAGDTTNVIYILKKKDDKGNVVRNELAEGQFKALMASLSPSFPDAGGSPRKIMEAADGFEVLGLTSVRTNAKDKNNIKHYTSLESVQVL